VNPGTYNAPRRRPSSEEKKAFQEKIGDEFD
jgi:hypothetical protein